MGLDLEAYFARIRYAGPRDATLVTLNALLAAHVQTIPFENLDVLLGRRIALEIDALEAKLVRDRRGGYCFEQNALFLAVLQELGFEARPCSARVRYQRPPDAGPPARTHLFLRVLVEGVAWLADVGVGGLSLTGALRLDTEAPQATPHETRRIVREARRDLDVAVHQVRFGAEWADVYEFTGEEMPAIDRTVGNWYTSTHPGSHFKNRLTVARALPEGRRVALLNRELVLRGADGVADTRVLESPGELLAVLASQFGLEFPAGTRFPCPALDFPSGR